MKERMRFVVTAEQDQESLAELCRQWGISRKTGYKWLARWQAEGAEGLGERSRAPLRHPNAVAEAIVEAVLRARERHPTWGPRKLRPLAADAALAPAWPAASTIGDILGRYGLTVTRRLRRQVPPGGWAPTEPEAPNEEWCADFKGWFLTGDGTRCEPLTITDNASRWLLCCQPVPSTGHRAVRPLFEAIFREYGLPQRIRSDNGPPFASTGAGGLTPLAVWWIKQGILPVRITPGHPQENGRHERMHRTLKQDTATPPAATLREQQRRFHQFQQDYNLERPHEALGQLPPASRYTKSPRSYPAPPREPVYPDAAEIRRVRQNGDIRWRGQKVFISTSLPGEPVAVLEAEHGWTVWFGPIELGQIDPKEWRLIHPKRRRTPPQTIGPCG